MSVASAISTGINAITGRKASKAIKRGAAANTALQGKIYEESKGMLEPWRVQGERAITRMGDMFLGEDGPDYSAFYKSPGYQFALDEGMRGIENRNSVSGLLSGKTIKDMIRWGQGHASRYFNNYVNTLQNISNAGQRAVGTTATMGQNYANAVSQNNTTAANATAARWMGMGNLATQAAGDYMYYNPGSGIINFGGNSGMGSVYGGGGSIYGETT